MNIIFRILKLRLSEVLFTCCLVFLLLILALPSCNKIKSENFKRTVVEQFYTKLDTAKDEDAELLLSYAEFHIEQIYLGQLAQCRSTNVDVKNLGVMMEHNHTKALEVIKKLAITKKIMIPTSTIQHATKNIIKLKDAKIAKFDKEYCDMMVIEHQDAIIKFEKSFTNINDSASRLWSQSMIPEIRSQLYCSVNCRY